MQVGSLSFDSQSVTTASVYHLSVVWRGFCYSPAGDSGLNASLSSKLVSWWISIMLQNPLMPLSWALWTYMPSHKRDTTPKRKYNAEQYRTFHAFYASIAEQSIGALGVLNKVFFVALSYHQRYDLLSFTRKCGSNTTFVWISGNIWLV